MRRNRKLSNIIFLYVFFANIVIFAIIMGILSYMVYTSVADTVSQSRLDVLKQVAEESRKVRNTAINVANNIYDQTSVDLLDTENRDSEDLNKRLEAISSNNETVMSEFNMEFGTMIIMKDGYEYSSAAKPNVSFSEIKATYWYTRIYSGKEPEIWAIRFKTVEDSTIMILSYGKVIRNDKSEFLGIILVNLSENTINNAFASITSENNLIYILDENGKVVSHSNPNLLGFPLYDMNYYKSVTNFDSYMMVSDANQKLIVTNYFDPETKWTIAEAINLSKLLEPYNRIGRFAIIIMIGVTAFSVFMAFVVSKIIAKPLTKLADKMLKAGNADFELVASQTDYYEVFTVNKKFNEMIIKIQDLIQRIKQEEKVKRKAELDFLQAQINPHFLHNTLLSIKCLVALGKTDKAEGMLECFIAMLKMPISPTMQFITLEEEVAYAANYIRLMEYRYENHIDFIKHIDPQYLALQVPRMILQPIIENAIFHGFMDNPENSVITLAVNPAQDKIEIRITDNGIGMTPEQIEKIWEDNPHKRKKSFNQIGLKNIRDRIKSIYGDDYGISFESEYGKGTRVILTIANQVAPEGI